ncbi:hypothetical protein G9A89_023804 [Geosiphon pyriformis]|nr:hypothetical protein G9A89_023804 [Geosiphon pyriformis]
MSGMSSEGRETTSLEAYDLEYVNKTTATEALYQQQEIKCVVPSENPDNSTALSESLFLNTGEFNSGSFNETPDLLNKKPKWENSSKMVAIFVVRFDTKHGNVIEWQYPDDVDLQGVEFSAMPSGLHGVEKDVIYFAKPPYIGLSVFQNVPTFDQSQERGAKMAALGILVSPLPTCEFYGKPWRHLKFLQDQVRQHVNFPGDYSDLQRYFEDCSFAVNTETNHYYLSDSEDGPSMSRGNSAFRDQLLLSNNHFPIDSGVMKGKFFRREANSFSLDHPARYFPKFITSFGPAIFVLWKAALLNKRILFYTAPPVEETCYFVYGTSLLAKLSSSISRDLSKNPEKLETLFCIGINEFDLLKSIQGGYVACTTDRILQHKPDLYDLIVSFTSEANISIPILTPSPNSSSFIQNLTKFNTTDIRRYRTLSSLLARDAGQDLRLNESNYLPSWLNIFFGGGSWWYERYNGYQRINSRHDEGQDMNENTLSASSNGAAKDLARINPPRDYRDIEFETLRYFHTLTSDLLGSLNSIMTAASLFETDNQVTYLYPGHMSQLGLDLRGDAAFVKELASIYFGKEVQVVGTEIDTGGRVGRFLAYVDFNRI